MRPIDAVEKYASHFPDRPCLESDDFSFTYAETKEAMCEIAAAMDAVDFNDAGRAGVLSPNDPRAYLCVLGILKAGGTWAPLNARNAVAANADFLDLIDCELLFYHSSLEDQVIEFKSVVPTLKTLICIDKASEIEGEAVMSLDQFRSEHGQGKVPDVPEDRDRLALIQATGGTTGRSKGVRMTNLTIEHLMVGYITGFPLGAPPVHLVAAPMTHAAGFLGFGVMCAGGVNKVMAAVDPAEILRRIEAEKISHLFLPPAALYALLDHPDIGKYDYSSLRQFLVAAAPVSPDRLAEAAKVFPTGVCTGYGQTEAPITMTTLWPEELQAASKPGGKKELFRSVGRALPTLRVEVMDDAGNILPAGEAGEIVSKGFLITDGYHKNPEETEVIRKFGWHHTGDVGYRDEDGYFYIVDRKKDMIITGGFNVFSAEVEKTVSEHDAVQDCSVIGVPDDKWGEAIKAIVTKRPGFDIQDDVLERDIIALCKEKMGSVKAPKSVEVWDALPVSPVGKVLKREIRKQFWGDQDRMVN